MGRIEAHPKLNASTQTALVVRQFVARSPTKSPSCAPVATTPRVTLAIRRGPMDEWHRHGFLVDSSISRCHTRYGTMKMTMHIDENVLAEVMDVFGFETKTDAVNTALVEMIRKRKLREMMKSGMGLEKGEYAGGLLAGYDPLKLRVAETPGDADGDH